MKDGDYGHQLLNPGSVEETAVVMVINSDFRTPSVSSDDDEHHTKRSSLCSSQAEQSEEGYNQGGLSDSEQDQTGGEHGTDDDSMVNSEDTESVSINSSCEGTSDGPYDSMHFPFGLRGTEE